MERSGERTFGIHSIVEQKPFDKGAYKEFFRRWCEVNDSIQIHAMQRNRWNLRKEIGILEEKSDGGKILHVPRDLKLWEMIGIMEIVDKDTFTVKAERQGEAKEKLLALGKTFEDAGAYIAKRLENIPEGKEVAEALAVEFSQYGRALGSGAYPRGEIGIEEIAKRELTPEETEHVDRFLAGDDLYESRRTRAEYSIPETRAQETTHERERQKTLAQFFRVAEQAFSLERKSREEGLEAYDATRKPWQSDTPIHNAFLQRVEQGMKRQVEAPKQEFQMAIFRRGFEKLVSDMKEKRGWRYSLNGFFEKLGLDLRVEERKLSDVLQIPKLKAELEAVRRSGNLRRIRNKERKIADVIQKAVSQFPGRDGANDPSKILVDQHINCAGASALGGALMEEAGLNYLVVSVPHHSILFLVTSDGRVEWRDMLNPDHNEYLRDKMLQGSKKDGSPLTVAEIVAFSKDPSSEGVRFEMTPKYYKKLFALQVGDRPDVTVFGPELGQYLQLLGNTGAALLTLKINTEAIEVYQGMIAFDPKEASSYGDLGIALARNHQTAEAIKAFRQAIALDPKYVIGYFNMAHWLSTIGRKEEAIKLYQQAISLEPRYVNAYVNMGVALADLDRKEEAAKAFRQAITIKSDDPDSYCHLGNVLHKLGREEEAVKVYEQAIAVNPKFSAAYGGLSSVLRSLGRNKQAADAMLKAIDLSDRDEHWKEQARRQALELSTKK